MRSRRSRIRLPSRSWWSCSRTRTLRSASSRPRRWGSTNMRMLNALVFGAGVVVVSVAPGSAPSVVTGEALVIVDEVVVHEQGAPSREAQSATRDEAENVAALIAAVRNGNPVLCELAARGASWDGNWRHVGPASPRHPRSAPTRERVRFAASPPKGRDVTPPLRAALGDPD